MKNKPFRCLDLSSFDKNRNKLVEKEGLSKPQLMQFCMISNIDMHERLWKCIHFCIGTKNSKSVEEEILSKTVGHIVLYNISILKCFKCSLNVFIIVSWQKRTNQLRRKASLKPWLIQFCIWSLLKPAFTISIWHLGVAGEEGDNDDEDFDFDIVLKNISVPKPSRPSFKAIAFVEVAVPGGVPVPQRRLYPLYMLSWCRWRWVGS